MPASALVPSAGPIDENLYCLFCGYNLRGLSGDPVRCPECGKFNDLGNCTIPAEFIKKALRHMEGAIVNCVLWAGVLLFLGTLGTLAGWVSVVVTGRVLLGLVPVGAWVICFGAARWRFKARPGWLRLLFDFHAAFVLSSLILPTALLAHLPFDRPVFTSIGLPISLAFVLVVPACVAGLMIYYRARRRLAEMQRKEAMRIARDLLRRELQRGKGDRG